MFHPHRIAKVEPPNGLKRSTQERKWIWVTVLAKTHVTILSSLAFSSFGDYAAKVRRYSLGEFTAVQPT
ncbi:MAG TPA: hypothetical protein PLN12_16720, partial [Flavobacteriales bacterium]|nr:hypothetical protein [Flavobacteriales bacterium]